MSDLLTGLTSGVHATARVHVATTTWTYDELLGAAAAAGPLLAPYRRVAVHATPSATTVLAVVGAVLAGVEVVPVPPDAGRSELAHLLTDSAAEAWAGPVPDDRVSGLPVVDLDLGAHACHEPRDVAEDATAMVVYTSGTTGLPKGVVLSRRAVAAGLDALAGAWDWDASDTLAHGLPLFHVHGLVLGVLGALRLGCGLLHVGKPTPAAYADAVRSGATVLFGVPTLWSRIAASPDDAAALRPARLLVSGSAPLPAPVFDRLRELSGHGVVERYGMSETLVTLATRADAEPRAGWVGVPVAGVATRLRDEDGHPVPHDGESVGQLEVRGPSLLEGYLGRPDADAEAWTADGWFRTGDVAVVDPDGWHRIVGRASVDLIKSGGYRIGAGEVETVLLGHAAVAEVAVVGVPDPDLGQRVVAHVVLRDGYAAGDALAAELVAHVGTELNGHKRPREVRFVAGLPRTALGKVQKAALSAG